MKIGNLFVLLDGRLVVGPHPSKLLFTCVLLLLPFVLVLGMGFSVQYTFNSFYPALGVLAAFFLVTIYYLCSTAFRDPGIVPPVGLAKALFDQRIAPRLRERDRTLTLAQMHEHRFYKFLTQPHPSRCPLAFEEKENKVMARFCLACKLFKAQRTTHSRKSDLCIQRYDHYCVWIGHDVGMLNHYQFYKMAVFITVFICVAAVFGVLQLVETLLLIFGCRDRENAQYCARRPEMAWMWVSLAGALVLMALFAYFCFSMGQLLAFHIRMLLTGHLTKEDLGQKQQNFNYTAAYNHFSRAKNLLAIRNNQLQNGSLLRAMLEFFKCVEKDAETMGMNQLQDKYSKRFTADQTNYYAAIIENLPPEDVHESSESSDRYAHIFTPGWDYREVAKLLSISERISDGDAVIPYLAGLYAVNTGRKFIINTPNQVEAYKQSHPDMFVERPPMQLLLSLCSHKHTNGPDTKPPDQYGGRYDGRAEARQSAAHAHPRAVEMQEVRVQTADDLIEWDDQKSASEIEESLNRLREIAHGGEPPGLNPQFDGGEPSK